MGLKETSINSYKKRPFKNEMKIQTCKLDNTTSYKIIFLTQSLYRKKLVYRSVKKIMVNNLLDKKDD